MPSARPIPNQDFLGRCYDIVTLDPLNLSGSAKYENALDVQAADDRIVDTRDGTFAIPVWADHKGIFTLDWDATTGAISSSYEFQEEFKQSVKAEAGVDGMFEFSGSAASAEITRGTESRKQTFVFARACRATHGLKADLENENLPVRLTDAFSSAVAALPVGEFSSVRDAYESFIKRFGTHFATEIVLGGLAFQRTRGSASRYLSSREKESELKAQASVEIEAFKGGAGAEQAKKQAATVDKQNELERTSLQFRGGIGSPTGIDSSWIDSLEDKPVPVQASLERLSSLLTGRFFPQEEDIKAKRILLNLAISGWIVAKGTPACDKRPLQYGEPLVLCMRSDDGAQILPALFNSESRLIIWSAWTPPLPLATLVLERADDRHAEGTVLTGDRVRLKIQGTAYYVPGQDYQAKVTDTATDATVFTVLLHGDNPEAPSRLGQYFLESDDVQFVHRASNAKTWYLRWYAGTPVTERTLSNDESKPQYVTDPGSLALVRFTLRRPGAEPGPEG